MKTVEEILNDFVDDNYELSINDAIEAMKLYANAKLDEAAEQLGNHPAYFNEIQSYQHDKQSILSLKDNI